MAAEMGRRDRDTQEHGNAVDVATTGQLVEYPALPGDKSRAILLHRDYCVFLGI